MFLFHCLSRHVRIVYVLCFVNRPKICSKLKILKSTISQFFTLYFHRCVQEKANMCKIWKNERAFFEQKLEFWNFGQEITATLVFIEYFYTLWAVENRNACDAFSKSSFFHYVNHFFFLFSWLAGPNAAYLPEPRTY